MELINIIILLIILLFYFYRNNMIVIFVKLLVDCLKKIIIININFIFIIKVILLYF